MITAVGNSAERHSGHGSEISWSASLAPAFSSQTASTPVSAAQLSGKSRVFDRGTRTLPSMIAGVSDRSQQIAPRMALALVVATASTFLSDHFTAAVTLYALLLGRAFG